MSRREVVWALLGFVVGVCVALRMMAVQDNGNGSGGLSATTRGLLEESNVYNQTESADEVEEEEEEEENPVLDNTIIAGIAVFIILMTILFEYSKETLEESVNRSSKPIVESLFGELTVLGFLSMFTFVVTKAGFFYSLGEKWFGPEKHDELLEVFESVHYTIFFIMIFFVFQVLVLMKEANDTEKRWIGYDRKLRNPEIDWPRVARNLELNSTKDTVMRWIRSYAAVIPFCGPSLEEDETTVLVLFKALRDEFVLDRELDYPFSPSQEQLQDDFNFGRYLGMCQASMLTKVVHVKISTWLWLIAMVVVYYLYVLLVQCNKTILSWTWVAFIWILCLYNVHFERHLLLIITAFASKEVTYIAHQDESPDDGESASLLESDSASTRDRFLPDWCRVDIERYLANRPMLTRWLVGGVPNRQQALYWMDHKGPSLYLFVLQFDLLFNGIFAAIQCISVGPYMYDTQPRWQFALYVTLCILPVLNISVNKRRLVAVLTPVCNLGFYRRPQIIAAVIREEKALKSMHTFITIYKLRRFAMNPGTPKKSHGLPYSQVFDQQEIDEVSRMFDEFDLDGGGSISIDEFEHLMTRLGTSLSHEELQSMVKALDVDQSGGVDRNEFLQWYADYAANDDVTEQEFAHYLFRVFDENDSGELTIGEFKKKLEQITSGFSLEEISDLVNELDSNNGGTICEEEFEHLIHKYYPKKPSH